MTKVFLDLLAEERMALLAAQYSKLDDICQRKEAAFAELEQKGEVTNAMLDQLRQNLSLIAAAKSGVQSARDRISELENVQHGFTSYDPNGVTFQSSTDGSELSKSV